MNITDPLFPNQWNLKLMLVPPCWDITTGTNIVIGIIDSGVDGSHADLGGDGSIQISAMDGKATRIAKYTPILDSIRKLTHPKILPGWNFVDDNDDTWDSYRHGTYLAGTIAAESDGIGMVGIAPTCKIRPYVVVDTNGYTTPSLVSKAIRKATDDNCDIINLSLAFPIIGSDDINLLYGAVNYADNRNCIVVAATGNDNQLNIKYPAKLENVITVGGCDSIGNRWIVNSNRGSNWGPEILCVCPGASQVSTYYMRSRYTDVDGTSQATANMSGVVALLKSVKKDLTTLELKEMIKKQGGIWNQETGYGVPNAYKLLTSLPKGNEIKNKLLEIKKGLDTFSKTLEDIIIH